MNKVLVSDLLSQRGLDVLAESGDFEVDVDLNLYWDVSGGVEERQERAKLIIDIKNIAEDLGIEFYDGRVRQQR